MPVAPTQDDRCTRKEQARGRTCEVAECGRQAVDSVPATAPDGLHGTLYLFQSCKYAWEIGRRDPAAQGEETDV